MNMAGEMTSFAAYQRWVDSKFRCLAMNKNYYLKAAVVAQKMLRSDEKEYF